MKAVIMAGGEGTRLRPLTCTAPKPMARIFGKPIIEYILDLLYSAGVDEAAITLGYMPDMIERHFENGYKGMKLNFIREDEPLGTAGGVKNAAEGFTEPFIVISGDAMCSFDLAAIMDNHRRTGAKITIAVTDAADPREYGIVKSDAAGRVVGFVEKPSWSQAVSTNVNTGIYVINPECMNHVEKGKPVDFAKNLFPFMLANNMPIFACPCKGYWCDVGNIEAYIGCHRDIFDGKMNALGSPIARGIYSDGKLPKGDYTLVPPVYVGRGAEIADGAIVGPYSVVDSGSYVGRGSRVRYSVVLENCSLAANVCVTGALVCSGVSLKSGAAMFEGSVAGSGAVIGSAASINPDVLVWPGKIIGSGAVVSANVKYGSVRADWLDDDGMSEAGGASITAETCVKLGAAVGSTPQGKKTGVAFDGSNTARAMYTSLIGGLMSAGSHVWNFLDCFEAQLNFFVNFCGLETGLFVSGGDEKAIKICGEGGLSIPRGFERDIESRMSRCEFKQASESEIRECADMSSVKKLYKQELIRQAPFGLGGSSAAIECENDAIKFLLEDSFRKLGAMGEGTTTFFINNAGTDVYARIETGESVEYEKLLAICCLNEFKNGKDISVPYNAPQFIDTIAAQYGRRVYRYLSSPADNSDFDARRLAAKQIFVRDALFMTVRIVSIMYERDASLSRLARELPGSFMLKRTVPISLSPAKLTQIIGDERADSSNNREGIRVVRDKGKLLIIPERGGDRVKLFAEAFSMEAAKELCDSVEELIASAAEAENSQ